MRSKRRILFWSAAIYRSFHVVVRCRLWQRSTTTMISDKAQLTHEALQNQTLTGLRRAIHKAPAANAIRPQMPQRYSEPTRKNAAAPKAAMNHGSSRLKTASTDR